MYYNLPRFILKIKGFKKLSLIIDMEPFRKIFKINGEGLFIKGEQLSKTFSIYKDGRLVAEVNDDRDTYELTIIDEPLEILIVCFMIGMNMVHDSLNYNMKKTT